MVLTSQKAAPKRAGTVKVVKKTVPAKEAPAPAAEEQAQDKEEEKPAEPERPVARREKAPARASYFLVPQTGELHNRPGDGWVELTPEQTAEASALSRRQRAAWWRQQQRKADAARW